MRKITKIALLLISILLASCELTSPGLGPQVDLTGPELRLLSPANMANVPDRFLVEGTAWDNTAVSSISVLIEQKGEGSNYNTLAEWRFNGESWQIKGADGQWSNYDGTWELNEEGRHDWSLTLEIPGSQNGSFVITARASDARGNSNADSVEQRTVLRDNSEPLLVLTKPVNILDHDFSEASTRAAALTLRTPEDLYYMNNGTLSLAGYQTEESPLVELQIELAGDDADDIYWSTSLTEGLINWSVDVAPGTILDPASRNPINDKTLMQIITRSTDGAGNTEEKSNGWICYWPQSDIPWISMEMDPSDAGIVTTYPGYDIEGQALDDDGIASVSYLLYRGQGGGRSLVEDTTLNYSNASSVTWGFKAPDEAGIYSIDVSCTDKNGSTSGSFSGLFTVEDITIPGVEIDEAILNGALLGDSSGNFSISGTVNDDSGVTDLRLVWINPNSLNGELNYMDKTSVDWESTGADAQGNLRWNVPLGASSSNSMGRIENSFSQQVNLFSDLGIDGTHALGNMIFILRVKDGNNQIRLLRIATLGDNQAPSLSLDRIEVFNDLGNSIFDEALSSTLRLPYLDSNMECRISGTWSDNSTDRWSDKGNIGAVSLNWNGSDIPVVRNNDGTWQSHSFPTTSSPVANISVQIDDWGGNRTTEILSLEVASEVPELLRISSTNNNGYYRAGQTVSIYLDFNKSISWSGGSAPQLELNSASGRRADYASGNGTNRHVFTYTVQSGDNTLNRLGVTAIISNGNLWSDGTSSLDISQLPVGVDSLQGNRELIIDTLAPTILSISTTKPVGYYNSSDSFSLIVKYSEDVVLSGAGSPRLELNSGVSVYADYTTMLSADTMSCTYNISNGENCSELRIDSLDLNGAVFEDRAGNPLITTLPSSGSIGKTIVIDTTDPNSPNLTGISDGVFYEDQVFSISGESQATLQFSLNNGVSWSNYSGAYSLTQNNNYEVIARQIDRAGNISSNSSVVSLSIDKGNLLQRIYSSNTDGRYKAGDVIAIALKFRKNLTFVGGDRPELLMSTGHSALFDSQSGNTWWFNYTVSSTDVEARLDVNSISWGGAVPHDGGMDSLINYIDETSLSSENTLAGSKSIELIAGLPTLSSFSYSGNQITLEFNRPIFRGTGEFQLEQIDADYRVPVLLSISEYNEIYNRANSTQRTSLNNSYSLQSNGASASGEPNLGNQYVLNYNLSNIDSNLKTIFRALNSHLVEIPVGSSSVSISGNSLVISMNGSYALPVMGAEYEFTMPSGIVQDSLNQVNPAVIVSDGYTLISTGVEPPVIRVDRISESLEASGGTVIADQPETTTFQIDCETPGATIRYEMDSLSYSAANVINPNSTVPSPDSSMPNPSDPTISSNLYTAKTTIGDAANTQDGYKIWLKAKAYLGSDESSVSNEVAFRSVLRFDRNGLSLNNYNNSSGDNSQDWVESVWIRGGDSTTGENTQASFPLSWNPADYDGVRLMTEDGDDWYWITWEINTTAYNSLLSGTTPDTLSEALEGPGAFGWMKNSYVPFKEYYALFPGESRIIQSDIYPNFEGRGTFVFAEDTEGEFQYKP